jgi:hypothetical protein
VSSSPISTESTNFNEEAGVVQDFTSDSAFLEKSLRRRRTQGETVVHEAAYVLGYTSWDLNKDGRLRTIRVEVSVLGASVRNAVRLLPPAVIHAGKTSIPGSVFQQSQTRRFCMKATLSMMTLSIALGVGLAQTPPPNPPTQETQKTTNTQPDAKTGTSTGSASTPLTEMKTMTFKGVLLDMSCASPASAGGATQPSDTSKASAPDQSNTANRSMSDSGASCPVTANSSVLGLKLDDGKTVRFDLVGNQRAQDALKNDKRWNKELSANKPIHAKADGVLEGDKLIVTSIH